MDAVMTIKLLLVSEFAKMLVCTFSSSRLNSAAKQMEKIAVTHGPIAFSSATVPASRSGDGQLWRPCEKLKGNFSCPANLTPLLRMNQKRNTLVEQKESERGRESEGKSETSCLEVPHLYNGAAAHAHNCVQVWVKSNAQFVFIAISEMFRQGRLFFRGWGSSWAALLYMRL